MELKHNITFQLSFQLKHNITFQLSFHMKYNITLECLINVTSRLFILGKFVSRHALIKHRRDDYFWEGDFLENKITLKMFE